MSSAAESAAAKPAVEKTLAITGVRASDIERDAVVEVLYRAMADGRLDVAETDSRVVRAYAARLRTDLPPLVSDLPDDQPEPAPASTRVTIWSTFWASLAWRARAIVLAAVCGLLLLGGAAGAALGDVDGGAGGHHQHEQEPGPVSGR